MFDMLARQQQYCHPQQLSMTAETGHNKEEGGEVEEEDDAMQNTVVLFSNTDKFVLLQVLLRPFTTNEKILQKTLN